jgi:hypothetical protein
MPTKNDFLLITFEGTFTSFILGKKNKKKPQNSINQGFSDYFAW